MGTKSNYTDDALLSFMRQDDQEAFTLLYRRYCTGLLATAAKAIREKEDAKDIVQEVFLSLWNRRKELRIESSLGAYLDTSVRYKAINYIEKNITRRDYLSVMSKYRLESAPASPEGIFRVKEIQKTISGTIAKMPPKTREAYLLSRHDNLKHKEIAERMKISGETVKKHIQYGLHKIKKAPGTIPPQS